MPSRAVVFRYAERRAAPALDPWIRNYWCFMVGEGAPPHHHVPPDGCTAVVIPLQAGRPALLSGPWHAPLAVPIAPGDRYCGVRLHPGALLPVLGVDPATMRDRVIPAPPPLQALADAVRSAVGDAAPDPDRLATTLDALLAPFTSTAPPIDPLVARAVAALIASRGEMPIAELAAQVGTSERTLRRRFGAATGQSPKEFARVRRMLAAAWQIARTDATWSTVAHAAGYADQSHLHRDVADFTGLTPGRFGDLVRRTAHDTVEP